MNNNPTIEEAVALALDKQLTKLDAWQLDRLCALHNFAAGAGSINVQVKWPLAIRLGLIGRDLGDTTNNELDEYLGLLEQAFGKALDEHTKAKSMSDYPLLTHIGAVAGDMLQELDGERFKQLHAFAQSDAGKRVAVPWRLAASLCRFHDSAALGHEVSAEVYLKLLNEAFGEAFEEYQRGVSKQSRPRRDDGRGSQLQEMIDSYNALQRHFVGSGVEQEIHQDVTRVASAIYALLDHDKHKRKQAVDAGDWNKEQRLQVILERLPAVFTRAQVATAAETVGLSTARVEGLLDAIYDPA